MKITYVSDLIKNHDNNEYHVRQPIGLLDFCYDLEHTIRGVRTTPRDVRTSWVYMPHDVLPMGWVGFGDFRYSASENVDSYVVYSRCIENAKYNGGDLMHMKMSTKRKVALRNAKKFLRSYSPVEVTKALSTIPKDAARELEHETRTEQTELYRKLFHVGYRDCEPRVSQELRTLLETGHTFMDKSVETDLRACFAAVDEHKDKQQQIDMYCVIASERMGRQIFEVVKANNVSSWASDIDNEVSRYDGTTLPEDLAGKMAVLSMCAVEQYVPDVGVRAAENVFYVAQ